MANVLLIGLCGAVVVLLLLSCASSFRRRPNRPTYKVRRLTEPLIIDANWDKHHWKKLPALELKHYMGKKPPHRPRTQAKVLYDDDNIYVIFRVQDRYVRAVVQQPNGLVCTDSCVEFFFTPGPDTKAGYFNLEVNAGGTPLFNFQKIPRKGILPIDPQDICKIEIAHSLPAVIEPEITEPVTWTIEYRIPITLLEKYFPVVRPAPGITWPANFFKCADKSSHPHWLTWSPVDRPEPDFHVPECFGTLEFQ
jgi:hypothetical protein